MSEATDFYGIKAKNGTEYLNKVVNAIVLNIAETNDPVLIAFAKRHGIENGVPPNWHDDPRVKDPNITNDTLLLVRNELRAQKRFEEADEIRGLFHEMGLEIEDNRDGTSWLRRK